jgi:uncharacterized protein YjaG (DUF416 family)
MPRRRGRSQEDERRVSELHERRQELVGRLIVNERYAAQLEELSDRHCAALAAAAAERLLPLYEVFRRAEQWGDYEFLRRGLDSVWAVLAGERSADDLSGLSAEGEDRTVPDLSGDERWKSEWVSEAQDAAISVLLTMDAAAEEDRENALHAVQYEIDALDNYIARLAPVRRTKPDPARDTLVQALEEAVEREEKTLEHRLVKEVVRLIERDLEVLRSSRELTPETVRALRASAEQNSIVARIERS